MRFGLVYGVAALAIALSFSGAASARTVVATTAEAGGSIAVKTGDTLVVKLPGRWKAASNVTPELKLDKTITKGAGAHAKTSLTFSVASAGSAMLKVRNAITRRELSMLVDVKTR